MELQTRKNILVAVMAVSYLPLFLFLDYSLLSDPQGAVKVIAAFFGMFGVVMMIWQYLLGVRSIVTKFIPDMIWLNTWHQRFGIYGFLLISIHPSFMSLYYLSVGINFFIPSLATRFDQFKFIGEIAYTILLLTWLTSAIVRNKISYRWWKRIHLLNLIILPMALVHSLTIGTTLITTPLKYYWYFICVLATIILVYRFIFYPLLGWGRLRYRVSAVEHLTNDVIRIDLQSLQKYLTPRPGQFIYIRPLSQWETHPFTVSHYDESTHTLSISPKCSGRFSCKLQDIQPGELAWVDGPYGVFTQEAYTTTKPVVLIAGGIGITPFVRLIERLAQGWQKQVILFYGNQTEQEVAYRELMDNTARLNPSLQVIDVMSQQADYVGEKGYIDLTKLNKYLGNDLTGYDFFLCGPDAMMKSVTKMLKSAGVAKTSIYSERFSL